MHGYKLAISDGTISSMTCWVGNQSLSSCNNSLYFTGVAVLYLAHMHAFDPRRVQMGVPPDLRYTADCSYLITGNFQIGMVLLEPVSRQRMA